MGYKKVKETGIDYCQVCGKTFEKYDFCYYTPMDNNIVCIDHGEDHEDKQPRIYVPYDEQTEE